MGKTAYQVAVETRIEKAKRDRNAERIERNRHRNQMLSLIEQMLVELGQLEGVYVKANEHYISVGEQRFIVDFRDGVFQWFKAERDATIASNLFVGMAITIEDLHEKFGKFIGELD